MLTKEQQEFVAKSYIEIQSITKTAEFCNVTSSQVRGVMKKYNITGVNRVHSFNAKFFDKIDTIQKAYWLGFLYADGTVSISNGKKKAYRLSVEVAEVDRDFLELFKKTVNADNPIEEVERTVNGKPYSSVRLRLCSKGFVESLIDKGCLSNKSLILVFPEWLEERLVPHFIRGYFDGDGSIVCSENNWNSYEFSVIGTKPFLLKMQEILMEKFKFNKTQLGKKGRAYVLRYGGNAQMRVLRKWLYRNSSGVNLERKKQKWDCIPQERQRQKNIAKINRHCGNISTEAWPRWLPLPN
jgi:DNA-binding transcriptional regulator WhiA